MRNTITVLSIVLFLFIACDGTTYYYIPDDKKPLLVNIDTLCYLDSLKNNIDSFKISVAKSFQSDEEIRVETIIINYTLINMKNNSKNFYTHQTISPPIVGSMGYSYNRDANSLQSNVSIRGIIYPSVYVMKSSYSSPDTLPNAIYYTYKYGIVRYDYADGRKYERINNKMVK